MGLGGRRRKDESELTTGRVVQRRIGCRGGKGDDLLHRFCCSETNRAAEWCLYRRCRSDCVGGLPVMDVCGGSLQDRLEGAGAEGGAGGGGKQRDDGGGPDKTKSRIVGTKGEGEERGGGGLRHESKRRSRKL